MRILQLNKYFYPPHLGGVEHGRCSCSRELARRAGHRGHARSSANEGSRDRPRGSRVWTSCGRAPSRTRPPPCRWVCRGGARGGGTCASRRRPDVHMHLPVPVGRDLLARSGLQAAQRVTYHSDIVRQSLLGAAYAPFLRRVLARADRIIVGSPQLIEIEPIPRAPRREVPRRPLRHRRRPSLRATPRRARAAPSCAPGTRADRAVRGTSGVLQGRRRAARGDERRWTPTSIVIGKGPLEDELRQRTSGWAMADRVTFVRPLHDAELAAWYRRGRRVRAALRRGVGGVWARPARGARRRDSGGLDVPAHGRAVCEPPRRTGLTVPSGDAPALAAAIAEAPRRRALRRRLGEQARQSVLDEFTIPTMVDKIARGLRTRRTCHSGRRIRCPGAGS